MTTNVYDLQTGLMTSDSRWSCQEGDWIAYVDDTKFDKIISDDQLGFLFAGNMLKIAAWKGWIAQGRAGLPPDDDGINLSIIGIDMQTGQVVISTDYMLKSIIEEILAACYAGTGGNYAKDCWQVNRCAKRAVSSAMAQDDFSGGQVMFAERCSRQTNVDNTASVLSVIDQMKVRGMMINTKDDRKPVPLKEAANDPTNPVAQALARKVLAGKAELSAPFPGMNQPWTQEKKEEVLDVLKKYAPK